ncbi:hypothetical protein [Zobellia uliginosa]|uniref:hypothetical protein n=1 Tax=Zobellia uliginosa TaxID=143224 RepID=UPI0026E2A26F|nr:hypothetical protein [Zobellia uliginosa]MDO6517918.1 hypothetical protein [Zobellia uliginosa]
MTSQSRTKPPVWFWIVSAVALLWNLIGVAAYLADALMSVDQLNQFTQEQRLLYESRPIWVTAAYAFAVWAGTLGCVALLFRKKWAYTAFLVSLIGVLAQNVYQFFLSDTLQVMGEGALILALMVIIISIALLFFAKFSSTKAWIS